MSDAERDDLRLHEWRIAPPTADLFDRAMARVYPRAEDGDEPRAVAAELPAKPRRFGPTAVIASFLVGAAAAAALVIGIGVGGDADVRRDGSSHGEITADLPARPPPPPHRLWSENPPRTPTTGVRRLTSEDERRQLEARLRDAHAERWHRITSDPTRDLPFRGPIWATFKDAEQVVGLAAPFLDHCFEHASEELRSRDGEITAKLQVNSEPDVATKVYGLSFVEDGGALVSDRAFRDCVGSTLVMLELPATPTGQTGPGGWLISYTYRFVRGPGDSQPHAIPPPPVVFAPVPTGAELGARALHAIDELRYDEALRLAQMAGELDPSNTDALEAAALAGCYLSDAAVAINYAVLLGREARARVRAACKTTGTEVERPSTSFFGLP